MALSADKRRELRGKLIAAVQATNAATLYAGSYAGLVSGRVSAFNDAVGQTPFGLVQRGVVGDTTASPIPEAEVDIGGHIVVTNVTGATAVTDVGSLCYLTDDDVFTLTRSAINLPIGVVIRYNTGTQCEVLVFSYETLVSIAMGGAGRDILTTTATAISAGGIDPVARFLAPYHGRILSSRSVVVETLTGAGGDVDYTFEIGGVAVTGGGINVVIADAAVGTVAVGAAVTAANVFNEDDEIEVVLAETTALTAGLIEIQLQVERLPGF